MHQLETTGKAWLWSLVFCFFSVVLFTQPGHGQNEKVEVSASLDRRAVSPDETVVLTVTIQSSGSFDAQEPSLPPLNDFEVISRWSSEGMQAGLVQTPSGPQFQSMRRKIYNYQLAPKRMGTLNIYPVEVVVNGRSYRTSALSLQVSSNPGRAAPRAQPGARPAPGFDDDDEEEDLFSQLLKRGMRQMPQGGGLGNGSGARTLPTNPKEAFFIQIETDKTEAYVGEQVTASFYLYTTGLIRDLDTLKYPSLKGFWKEDIDIATHLNYQQEVIDGVAYKKALLASFALFPIKEGQAVIDSYQAKCTVVPGMDPFGMMGMGRAYTFTKSSQPVKILVKPLPMGGRPADFSGAVGDFTLTSRVEGSNIVADQPFSLKIRFEGRGNAKLIDTPALQLPEGMELYDTQKEAKFFTWGTSFKEFTLLVIPRRAGDFEIPAIRAAMFDPSQKKYVERVTSPIPLHVGQSPGGSGGSKDSESFTGLGQSPKTKVSKKSLVPELISQFRHESYLSQAELAGTAIGFYGFVFGLLLWRASRELEWGKGQLQMREVMKLRVKNLKKLAQKNAYREVGVGGVNLLAFVLGASLGDRIEVREILKLLSTAPPSIQDKFGAKIADLLREFEALAFAPVEVLGQKIDPAHLQDLIEQLNQVLLKVVSLVGSGERDT